MAARRLVWALGALLLASLSCHIRSPQAPSGRDLPPGLGGPGRSLYAGAPSPDCADVAARLARLPTGLSLGERETLACTIVREAAGAGLPVELVLAVILVESSGNTFAVSNAGAMGLMQLRPSTAEGVAAEIGLLWTGPSLLFDPEANVRLGVAYLERLIARYGDVETAIAAYNWGPAHIAARLRRGEALPVAYSSRVLAAAGSGALRAQRI